MPERSRRGRQDLLPEFLNIGPRAVSANPCSTARLLPVRGSTARGGPKDTTSIVAFGSVERAHQKTESIKLDLWLNNNFQKTQKESSHAKVWLPTTKETVMAPLTVLGKCSDPLRN